MKSPTDSVNDPPKLCKPSVAVKNGRHKMNIPELILPAMALDRKPKDENTDCRWRCRLHRLKPNVKSVSCEIKILGSPGRYARVLAKSGQVRSLNQYREQAQQVKSELCCRTICYTIVESLHAANSSQQSPYRVRPRTGGRHCEMNYKRKSHGVRKAPVCERCAHLLHLICGVLRILMLLSASGFHIHSVMPSGAELSCAPTISALGSGLFRQRPESSRTAKRKRQLRRQAIRRGLVDLIVDEGGMAYVLLGIRPREAEGGVLVRTAVLTGLLQTGCSRQTAADGLQQTDCISRANNRPCTSR